METESLASTLPGWGPTGQAVYERTYRRAKQNGDPETWYDTVVRVVDGNLGLVDKKHIEKSERDRLIDLFYNFKALPAGRHLWMSGVPGRQFLFNPVRGDTKVLTPSGEVMIKDLVGLDVDVLTMSDNCDMKTRSWESVGTWRKAHFIYSGIQRLYKVQFESGREVYATAEHRWYAYRSRTKLTTLDLVGHEIPIMTAPKPVKNDDYWIGLMHGHVFGDGTKDANGNTIIHFFGQAAVDVAPIFEKFGHKVKYKAHSEINGDHAYAGRLPGSWKDLPTEEKSSSYWYGFIVGLIAADGSVNKSSGTVALFNKDEKVLEIIKQKSILAGFAPGSVSMQRKTSPYDGSEKPCYILRFKRYAIDPSDLLLQHHRAYFEDTSVSLKVTTDRVAAVLDTGIDEEVYCCIQEETQSWTANGVLTANCWRAGFDAEDITTHFAFTFDQLMQGGGVGANYSNRYIKHYKAVKHAVNVHIVCDPEHANYDELIEYVSSEYSQLWDGAIRIEDSREGWSEALVQLISAFWNGATEIVFDLSLIRDRGSKIKTFGGTAAGPAPLAKLLSEVAALFSSRVGQRLNSLDYMLIDHFIANCVVSGNVRRSARMSIKSWADADILDFINCKADYVNHWSTNISVEIDDHFFRALKRKDEHAIEVYQAVVQGMLTNGEPGFYNLSLAQVGEVGDVGSTNPCVVGDTWVMTRMGPRQVSELVGESTDVYINGHLHSTTDLGFFETGIKPVFDLQTSEGYSLRLTKDHKVMTDRGWLEAGELLAGDKVHLHDHKGLSSTWDGLGSFDDGYLVGHYLGDGTTTQTPNGARVRLCSWGDSEGEQNVRTYLEKVAFSIPHRSDFEGWHDRGEYYSLMSAGVTNRISSFFGGQPSKKITTQMHRTSSEFQVGLISALFDTDGHVEGNSTSGGISIRLSQSDKRFLQEVQLMLLRFGIRSKLQKARDAGQSMLPDGNGGTKAFNTKACWRLIVTSDSERFMEQMKMMNVDKVDKWTERSDSMSRGFYRKPWACTFTELVAVGDEKVYDVQVPGVNAFDANGMHVHNCGEIALSEWEYCCLGHVNLSAFHDNIAGVMEAHRLMTRFLIRATFGDIPNERSYAIGSQNRRIGVGHFGFQGWLVKQGVRFSDSHRNAHVRQLLKDFYDVVRREARSYAFSLRIPEPIKVTTVAPTGTIAKLPGATEGIHPVYGRYFKRRVRYSTIDESQLDALRDFEQQGYDIEDCLYSANTKVVTFITKDTIVEEVENLGLDAEYLVESVDEIDIGDMLAVQAMYQECYADNAVSFTINVVPDQYSAEYIADTLIHYLPKLKGTTIMVDGTRPQAPYERITREAYYGSSHQEVSDGIDEDCATGACPIK